MWQLSWATLWWCMVGGPRQIRPWRMSGLWTCPTAPAPPWHGGGWRHLRRSLQRAPGPLPWWRMARRRQVLLPETPTFTVCLASSALLAVLEHFPDMGMVWVPRKESEWNSLIVQESSMVIFGGCALGRAFGDVWRLRIQAGQAQWEQLQANGR